MSIPESTNTSSETQFEKAVLVGLITQHQTENQLNEYLNELAFLAETAGAVTLKRFYQKLDKPDVATYVGSGKLAEIKDYVNAQGIDLVIFDDEISPSQQRNIEKELRCKVVDRSILILDIFAQRAQTLQARTQVELAQNQYLLPRLKGMWQHLDRVKGGIGMRGSGEKEIETDRRMIKTRISRLKEQLVKIDKQNQTQRKNRGELIRVSLVGYTNVGKSTIMNLLSKSEVFAENKLFATLDTTTRKVVIQHVPFLLSDTVGFIRKLPHHLIESFKTTLDEAKEADILLHVADISHPACDDQVATVNQTLAELKMDDKKIIMVFNKIDAYAQQHIDDFLHDEVKAELKQNLIQNWKNKIQHDIIFISALEKENIEIFKNALVESVKQMYLIRYPYKEDFWGYSFVDDNQPN